MVVTSALQGTFSAGLDIREMYDKNEEHLRLFWSSLQVSADGPIHNGNQY